MMHALKQEKPKSLIDYLSAEVGKKVAKHPELLKAIADIQAALEAGKGIIIAGNTGSGKTALTKALLSWLGVRFNFNTSLDLVIKYERSGLPPIYDYCLSQKWGNPFVIDDLGAEPIGNYFGRKIEVSEIYIQYLNEFWHRKPIAAIPIITTNLTWDEIEERYGARARWRINEMCATIVLGGDLNYTNFRK